MRPELRPGCHGAYLSVDARSSRQRKVRIWSELTNAPQRLKVVEQAFQLRRVGPPKLSDGLDLA
jgi:hypothetical protein